eukprot:10598821-Heterocapsa_arctica.AAC.1
MTAIDGEGRFQGAVAAKDAVGVFVCNRIPHAPEEDETLAPGVHAFATQGVGVGPPGLAQGTA